VEHFDLPPPALAIAVMAVVMVLPLALLTLVPMAIFRAAYRRHRPLWAGRLEHVVRAAYRGSTVSVETAPRVPFRVVFASFVSLFIALPVMVVAPAAIRSVALEGMSVGAAIGMTGALLMVACGIVGWTILRPSREAVLAARVVGGGELLFAMGAAYVSIMPCAVIAAGHAIVLFAGAAANARGNVRACI
jgi:hypothetical protein